MQFSSQTCNQLLYGSVKIIIKHVIYTHPSNLYDIIYINWPYKFLIINALMENMQVEH